MVWIWSSSFILSDEFLKHPELINSQGNLKNPSELTPEQFEYFKSIGAIYKVGD